MSLVEEHEFAGLEVPEFRRIVEASGIAWAYAPIPDGGVPDATFAKTWHAIGPRARNILRLGGRVVIHCRAGLGRTGSIVASLLVDFGMEPKAAIAAVRAARPHTIETKNQEAYVLACKPMARKPDRADAIAGCMIGVAAGDAIGSAFEMLDARSIEAGLGEPFCRTYTPALPGSLLYPRPPGYATDDTAMALAVAYVVAESDDLSARAFAEAFLTDLDRTTGRFGKIFWEGGPGLATTRSLAKLQSGADPENCGGPNDGGNGAAMRAHPIGILHDRNEALRVAAVQARVTQGHPSAIAAAQAVAALVYDALAGFEPTLEAPYGITDPTFVTAWRTAHTGIERGAQRLPEHLLSVNMSGWVTVASAAAIAWIYADDPGSAVAAAAASGGDTDTVASIVGAIVGARNGTLNEIGLQYMGGLAEVSLVRDAIDALTFKDVLPSFDQHSVKLEEVVPDCVAHRYGIDGGKVVLLGRELTPEQIVNATREIKSSGSLHEIVVRPAPSAGDILGTDLETHEVRELFDFGICEAMRELGVSNRQIDDIDAYGGSGSEYRRWLYEISMIAERFRASQILAPQSAHETSPKGETIADELIFVTRAVSFSMRYDDRQFPVALACGVQSLRALLPNFRKYVDREIKRRRNVAGAGFLPTIAS